MSSHRSWASLCRRTGVQAFSKFPQPAMAAAPRPRPPSCGRPHLLAFFCLVVATYGDLPRGFSDSKLGIEMFEIRDRYVAARKRNPELNRAMAAMGQIAPASIERGVDRILEVMRALQLPTGELELKPMMERMSDAVADTDAGSLKLSDLQDILRSLARKHDVMDRPVWEVLSDVVEQFDGLTFEESITKVRMDRPVATATTVAGCASGHHASGRSRRLHAFSI